ncbi:MAG: hypothetical protein U0797_30135 [Gemmataceae bacterium]
MLKRLGLMVAAAAVGLAQVGAAEQRLDNQLNDRMDGLIAGLKKKYKTVGVLRFRVQDGEGKATFGSPLAGRMVERLETLLVLHNGEKESQALGVVHDVAKVANKNKVGSWYTDAAERKKLFALQYPMAWGSKSITPDAFLTGKVTLSKDGKQTKVELEAFDKDNLNPRKIDTITLETDRFVLRDLGYSFAVAKRSRPMLAKARSIRDEDQQAVVKDGLQQNQDRRQQQQQQPKDKKDAQPKPQQQPQADPSNVGGVAFELLTDDKAASIRPNAAQGDVARWLVECPPAGAAVSMRLKNTTEKRLAVVLRVNGKSTINDQLAEPETAAKWVLEPGKSYRVKGSYMVELSGQAEARGKGLKRNDDSLITETEEKEKPGAKEPQPPQPPQQKGGPKIRPFKVLVGQEAVQMKSQLGDKAGWIDIDVYEQGSEPKQQEQGLITPKGLPQSSEKAARATYNGLRSALLKSSQLKAVVKEEKKANGLVVKRSMIVPDTEAITSSENVKLTNFPNSQFVARVTIKVTPNDAPPPGE